MPFPFGSRSSFRSTAPTASTSSSSSSTTTSPPAPSNDHDETTRRRSGRTLKPILTHGNSTGTNIPDRSVTLVASPTVSSMSSSTPSTSTSALHHAVSRGQEHHSSHSQEPHHHQHHGKPASKRSSSSSTTKTTDRTDLLPTQFRDPIHLAETAITSLFTVPGPPIEHLQKEVLPRLYHEAYEHRVNCREHGMKEMIELIARFRDKFSSVKIKFRSHLMDRDGTATLHAAAVGLVYEIHVRLARDSHSHGSSSSHETEPIRAPVISVVKIFEGKIAQVDMVV
ncbi:hypothetical protein C6P46_004487 [Rhodotorula mucilaginosa]|uniref:Uncharacterized protein n=1 Tax=Rhodotorula mucilaginosa TaxID=5537 RepID=A0A9P6W2E7_RHOMI|nr:hypothetical protein C6P46_004487 [Rhodotorula mucilaginosa]